MMCLNRWQRLLQPMMWQRRINKPTMLQMPWLLKLTELLLLPQQLHPLLLQPHLRRRCPRLISRIPPNLTLLLRRRYCRRRLPRQLRWLLRKQLMLLTIVFLSPRCVQCH